MYQILFLFLSFYGIGTVGSPPPLCEPDTQLLIASEQLLLRVRMAEATDSLTNFFATLSQAHIEKGLCNDDAKKTFWINIYNAYYQLLIKSGIPREGIFTRESIAVGEHLLSLDNIEHGILRRSAAKFSMGYAKNLFPKQYLQALQIETLDYRIHFALNCGAKSCPPIVFYQYHKLNEQLERATQGYLTAETILNEKKKEIEVPKLMQWFQGDFGGPKGVKTVLEKYLNQNLKCYKIRYQPFNNETYLNHFE